jgi:hypothetical protein
MQSAVIDDLSREPPVASIGTIWQVFTDRVMGGMSHGVVIRDTIAGRPAIRLRGIVSLENNGGFVQLSLDLTPSPGAFDASLYRGLELDVIGNDQDYNVHLRTDYLMRPWQSYRQSFKAKKEWRSIKLHFENFLPHRTDIPLDARRLRRIGIAAIGRAFTVDVAVGRVQFMT